MNIQHVTILCLHLTVIVILVHALEEDLQFPYRVSSRHRRDEIDISSCPQYSYGDRPNVKVPASTGPVAGNHSSNDENIEKSGSKFVLPIVESYHKTVAVGESYWNQRDTLVHVSYVNNPLETVSVYEPLYDGTCRPGQYRNGTVQHSSIERGCLLAVNAGFFNTTSGECYGNLVSEGRLVQDSEGIQNAHFGITRDGSLFFGYLSEIDIVAEDFMQLVGGVIWVLRDGKVNVDESISMECGDTEETGTVQRFASVISARTLVGSDKQGRLMVVQIDGKTDKFGANLYEAAEILQKLGAVHAVNLDGGGSSTMVINNTLVNYPSDWCGDFQCSRNVSTILCVHEPYCDPIDCGGHGSCELGVCRCHGNWKGDKCDHLDCPEQCSGHGICTEFGCLCLAGYHGDTCAIPCVPGWYGNKCLQKCHCDNNATCDITNGSCLCTSGFIGTFCQYKCKNGFYGVNCSSQCECDDECDCDHVTGSCNYTRSAVEYDQGLCVAKMFQQQKSLQEDMSEEYWNAIVAVIVLSVISSISLLINCGLLWQWGTKWRHKDSNVKYKRAQLSSNGQTFIFQPSHFSSFTTSTSSDELETSFMTKKKKKKPRS